MKHEYRYGDLVVGLPEASEHYTKTRYNTYWVVIHFGYGSIYVVPQLTFISGQKLKWSEKDYRKHENYYNVESRYFEFVRNMLSNKDNKHVLQTFID
jgi:hypothetical protein